MPRRQVILESVLVFAVFLAQGAWPAPEVNEPYYLGKAIHFWNPHWAESDWFLNTADAQPIFYFSAGWLSLWLSPPALAWTLRLATWAFLAWSWQRLSAAVLPRPWYSIVTAACFAFLLQHFNMAGEWVIGGAEAKGFAFPFVFLGLAAMIGGRWNRTWLLLGAASAIHVLVGGWSIAAVGVVRIGEYLRTKPTAESGQSGVRSRLPIPISEWLSILGAFVLALPGLIPALLLDRGADAATVKRAHEIYVFERFDHHLDASRFFSDGTIIPFSIMCLASILLWRSTNDSIGARRLRGFAFGAILIASCGLMLRLLAFYDKGLAAGVLRFYWFRLSDVAVPLGLALLGIRWIAQSKMHVARAVIIGLTLFHFCDCVVLRLFGDPPFGERWVDGIAWRSACLWATGRPERPIFPRQPRADRLTDYSSWIEACNWISKSGQIPAEARFLTPRTAQTFKWYAGRGEVANWKETPQDAASVVRWLKRIQDIYGTGLPPPADRYYNSLTPLGAKRLKALADKYEFDYAITQRNGAVLPLAVVYENPTYIVYKVR